jgi:hypothetical protein
MRTVATFAVALVALLASWSLTHHTTPADKLIVDTPIYAKYGFAMTHGRFPYRDIKIEYPPAALPMFILPALGRKRNLPAYTRWFDREMAVCACLALLGVFLITRAPAALAATATAPLLLGPVVLTRFDYWPTALAVLALAAVLRSRLAIGAVLLGVAIAAKIWPAILLPFVVTWLWRTRGRRPALAFTGGTAAVLAAIITPFAVISPHGTWYSVHQQFARPLQIESLGSAILVVIHHVAGTNLGVLSNYGSQNVGGWGAGPAAAILTVLLVGALVTVYVAFVRGESSRDNLLTAVAAAVTALVAFGKVFSPQYMIWLVPFVVLVPSAAAGVVLIASLLLTQLYFPSDYWGFAKYFYFRETLEVLLRDLVVVALFVILAARTLRRAPALRRRSAVAAAPAPRS